MGAVQTRLIATLSFDDGGWQDAYVLAALRRVKCPATFYLVADALDEYHYHRFVDDLPGLYSGFEVGCHTATHRRLLRAPEGVFGREILEAADTLRRRFPGPITCFSWPCGEVEPRAIPALRDAGLMFGRTVRMTAPLAWSAATRYAIPVTRFLPLACEARAIAGGPIHLFGHGYELRDNRREWELLALIGDLRQMGYEFLTNAAFFEATHAAS